MKVELNDGPSRTAGWVVMVRVAKRQLLHLTSTTSNKVQNSARDQIGGWAARARRGLLVKTAGLQRQHILKGECSSGAAATMLCEKAIDAGRYQMLAFTEAGLQSFSVD